jgi:prephenate dehydrogenase
LALTLGSANLPLVGSGFRDTTRIAAGDPDLWAGILLQNAGHVTDGIDRVQERLAEFRAALSKKDASAIRELLKEGQRKRMAVDDPHSND